MLFYYTEVMKKEFKNYVRSNLYNYTYNEKKGILTIKSINSEIIEKDFNIGKIKFPTNLLVIQKIAKGFNFTFSLFEYEIIEKKIVPRVVVN